MYSWTEGDWDGDGEENNARSAPGSALSSSAVRWQESQEQKISFVKGLHRRIKHHTVTWMFIPTQSTRDCSDQVSVGLHKHMCRSAQW